jgi:Rieske 2Fe-2S family protein
LLLCLLCSVASKSKSKKGQTPPFCSFLRAGHGSRESRPVLTFPMTPPIKGIEEAGITLDYHLVDSATNFAQKTTASGRGSSKCQPNGNGHVQSIADLVAHCSPGWSLPGKFYSDEQIYRADLEVIWRQGWLFAGHSCEIPEPGDYFTLNIDADSIVIARGDDGAIRGFHNVCRHRGSLVCTESKGRSKRLVCPYHQWTYDLEGKLLACRGMPEDLNKAHFSLKPVIVRDLDGLIYLSLAEAPSEFETAEQMISPFTRPQGFPKAKVAKAVDYLVKANWKLIWENNRECYHCNINHPQYIKANFDHYNADDTTPRIQAQITAAVLRSHQKAASARVAATHKRSGMTSFPDVANNIWYSVNRTPLVDGYVTESMDGKTVAPLMGTYENEHVDTLRIRTLPNFWNHSSCDHGVSTRLLPLGPQLTSVRVLWLVNQDAVEGRDYHLAKLLPFWQLTSEQDWEICERQQRGVNSSAYTPGPYSTYKEYNVDGFVRWYLKSLEAYHPSPHFTTDGHR